MILATIFNVVGMKGSIQTLTILKLTYSKIPPYNIYNIIETF